MSVSKSPPNSRLYTTKVQGLPCISTSRPQMRPRTIYAPETPVSPYSGT